jgi:DNA-directed RNA polymerase II subunit RPB2
MARLLTQHNTMSFENFINRDIPRIISDSRNVIRVLKNKENNEYKTKVYFNIGGKNGKGIRYKVPKKLPNDCRLDGLTYDGILEVDVEIVVNHGKDERNKTEKIELVKIPTMLHSKFCSLNGKTESELSTLGESPHEKGGYFIIKGLEKVVLSQEDHATNIIYTRVESGTGNLVASIDSKYGSSAPEKFSIVYDNKSKTIFATIPFMKGSIPIIILFRALGLESEHKILESICGSNLSSDLAESLAHEMIPSINEINQIYTQEIALKCLSILTKVQADKTNTNSMKWKGNLLYILNNRFLPHVGTDVDDYMLSLKNKSAYLGYMTRYLLSTKLGLREITDRDSLVYKRVRLPGEIMNDMFRDFYEEYLKGVKNKTDKLIELDKKENISAETILKDISESMYNILNSSDFQRSIDTSFMGRWGKNPSSARNEGVLQGYLRHSFMEAMSHLRRVHLHLPDGPNTMEQRRLHNSQWGYYCPVETPDGKSIGQHKHLAQTCTVSVEYEPTGLKRWLENEKGFEKLDLNSGNRFNPNIHNIFVNGDWVGTHSNPRVLMSNFKKKKQNKDDEDVHWSYSAAWIIRDSEIRILTTSGRMMRPLRLKGKPELKGVELLGCEPEILIKKGCEYIDPSESDTLLISMETDSEATHYEITKTASLGLTALTLPFIEHNPIARNLYATQQSRAAVSVYASNFRSRMDQKASLLHYGQCPIVNTGVVERLNNNKAPYGINIIVAIAACNGYNQEDAIIINKSAIENGLFVSSYYTTHSLREEITIPIQKKLKKNEIDNVGDIHIVNPKLADKEILKLHSNWDYSLLDENGIIKAGSRVDEKTVLIGGYMVDSKGNWIDNSIIAKNVHEGEYVERVHLSKTSPRIAKVLTREVRFPIVGDKFASRAAQKAVIGIIVPKEDMPYTRDGIVPDIIFNPHSFPSRMTIAYFLEILTGNIGLVSGRLIEVPNFNGLSEPHENIMDLLKQMNLEPNSEYKLYSGTSGKLVCGEACIGPIFYQRLKQMVSDKIFARGEYGPKDAITKQPLGGRSRGGGLKIGTMECDALVSHGMSQSVKEIFWDKADSYEMSIDKSTGRIVAHNPDRGIYHDGDVRNVQVPYAFKLLLQEVYSMGVSCKIGVEDSDIVG